jgi:prepilin-type N-terminal cleavage/methylation domain-containing protein
MTLRSRGFSLIEITIAIAVLLIVALVALKLIVPSQDLFAAQTEMADMQQRLRVASDALLGHLVAAGVGAYAGSSASPLIRWFAPVLPYRAGGPAADPPGSYKADTITVFSVARSATVPAATVYWLKSDVAAATYQLMVNEGASTDVPVVDHVVGLAFDYYGDPQPPLVRQPFDPAGPWPTTYGPAPPITAVAPFAAGENCLFASSATGPVPRLPALGAPGTTLLRLTPAQMTDGPWCPNDVEASRWDADLLRIRSIAVTVRVQAAVAALRGPASILFAHGGTARAATRWVPDLEMRFQVAPRNLNFGR